MSEDTAAVALVQQDNEVAVLMHRLEKIREIRDKVMKENVHFGTIPGTDTPALWQAGGDILKVSFKLRAIPKVDLDPDIPFPHRGYVVNTDIVHIQTGEIWATGYGSCSTLEKKYRWRWAARTCPTCGKPSIRKGKEEYGGGFFCNRNEDGCGARYKDNDAKITEQDVGRTENADLADLYNTVLKISKKRSFIDAILDATGAREQFIPPPEEEDDEEEKRREQRQAKGQPKQQKPKDTQPYAFQEKTLYVGTLRGAYPMVGSVPGRIEMDTEHGGLVCYFRVTPAAIINIMEWDKLKGKPCSVSFVLREGRTPGQTYPVVDEFQIVLDEPKEAAA